MQKISIRWKKRRPSGLSKASEHELNLNIHLSPLKPISVKQICDLFTQKLKILTRLCNLWGKK